MADAKTAEPSPEKIARAERQRLAMEEGARAMVDVEREAIAVRKNMERLRALRQAREAEEAKAQSTLNSVPKKKSKRPAAK
jgi:hypothetical protein